MKKGDQATSQPVDQEDEVLAESASTGVLRANTPAENTGRGPEEEVELFTMGWWNGFPQWKCNYCPWDTLEGEAVFMEHYRMAHMPPPEPQKPRIIPVADRFGNEVR